MLPFNTNFQSGVTRKISQDSPFWHWNPPVFTWMMQFMMFCQHMCDHAVRQNLTLLTLKKIRAIFGEKEKSYSFTLPCSQKSPYIQRDYILKIYYINSPLGLLSLWRKPNRHSIGRNSILGYWTLIYVLCSSREKDSISFGFKSRYLEVDYSCWLNKYWDSLFTKMLNVVILTI